MPLTPSPSPGGRGEQPSLLRNTTMYVRLFAAVWLIGGLSVIKFALT